MDEGEDSLFRLYGQDHFGLTSRSDLRALGARVIRVSVLLWPDDSTVQELAKVALAERPAAAHRWFEQTFERITTMLPITEVKLSRRSPRFHSFYCELPADSLDRLLHHAGVQVVILLAVEGMQRRPSKKNRGREPLEWYAVRARFAIQVEGQASGMQTYEERIVLVKARDFEDAERRLEPEFAEYSRSYFNGDWELVRWNFERVLDVYLTDLDRLDPTGSEVYSKFSSRRMRPEYEWHPLAENREAGSNGGRDDTTAAG
jgi:hypothetical protein